MAVAGISTLGIKFYYGVETFDTDGKTVLAPTSYTQLTRINEIGGISLETEQIDASALEDLIERDIAGRESTGKKMAA